MTRGAPPSASRDLLCELAPRVLAAVTRRFGDFAAAEDAVQEALLAAHVDWPAGETPANPGGWLYRVACRRIADHVKGEEARRRREALAGARDGEEAGVQTDEEAWTTAGGEGDDTLTLLFMCCHPSLGPTSAVALTLRAVGGLTTAEIAGAFLVPEATMSQRIRRAKQAIASSGARFTPPERAEHATRLAAVLHVLYLLFNEGYAASSGARLVRVELSAEAIRLARTLHRLQPDHPEVAGLLALMLLTDARRRARTGPSGELVPLEEQDRSLWDRGAIEEGTALVGAAFAKGTVGSYALQAAIAALHDAAPSVEATDWAQILAMYGILARMAESPMVELNRVVAAAMVHGPATGLEWLSRLEASGRLAGHYRLEAVRAHLCEMAGDPREAIRHFRAAASRTGNLAERHYLISKAARLEPPPERKS